MVVLGAYQPRIFPCLHWWARLLSSDRFVLLDDFQFKRGSWQNRYMVWMHDHPHRLTIPVDHNTLFKPINQVRVMEDGWREKHLKTLRQCYGGEPFFKEIYDLTEFCLNHPLLGEISVASIKHVIDMLGIDTDITYSSALNIDAKASDYLVELCRTLDADTYLCGGTAYNSYMELDKFKEAGIDVKVQNWKCTYEPYGDISILDPIMRFGEDARRCIE